MTHSMTFALERRIFLFATPGVIIVGCLVLLGAYAVISGKSHVGQWVDSHTEFVTLSNEAVDEWRAALVDIETKGEAPSVFTARPMSIILPATLPPAPLADFSVGGDLLPTTTKITGRTSPAKMFSGYEFANPTTLGLGRFDLTFLAVVILPLVMIAASFDVFAAERERGRARITAAQAGGINASIWKRLFFRNAAIWGVFFLIALAAALFAPAPQMSASRLASFAAWFGVASAYGLFWYALIAFAVAFAKRTETVAAILFSLWAVFVFAVPAVGGAVAEAAYPPPSRLVFLSEMREGEVEAVRETEKLANSFLAEHPEMALSSEQVPEYLRRWFLSNREAAERTTPVLDAFTQSRQNRKALVERLQFLSPALIANKALVTIAGSDVDRSMAFQDQARMALDDLHQRIGPAIVAKQRISVAEFDAIPRFSFQDRTLTQKVAGLVLPIGFLIGAATILLLLARRRLNAPLEKLL